MPRVQRPRPHRPSAFTPSSRALATPAGNPFLQVSTAQICQETRASRHRSGDRRSLSCPATFRGARTVAYAMQRARALSPTCMASSNRKMASFMSKLRKRKKRGGFMASRFSEA